MDSAIGQLAEYAEPCSQRELSATGEPFVAAKVMADLGGVATEHHSALISRCWLGWSDQEVIR